MLRALKTALSVTAAVATMSFVAAAPADAGYYRNGYYQNGYYRNGYYRNGYYRNGYYRNGYYRNGMQIEQALNGQVVGIEFSSK